MAVIVAVEDDPDVHQLLRLLLEDAGHEVHMATEALVGLDLVAEHGPGLVILDVSLPGGVDGVEACTRLRADGAHADLPVLMLTARAREEDQRRGMAAGASDYLVKPFDIVELLGRVEKLLG
ncbi:response regulator transcription factor [Nocardioides bruguierae]|uniref:Response regulator n=1 Tax=Nocardioides bruguierae TaxID=2945102 RepID=A0A9X2D428_9ACTN|nr:response regulator [Nocardioides bruguierae]MCL8024402.1 response regulator [Nocardioides bruguierae]MCM0618870.1 response regulator [Nocardioides bruguierae]